MKKIIFLLITFGSFFCKGSFINYDEITKKFDDLIKQDKSITLHEVEILLQEDKLNEDQKKIIFDNLVKIKIYHDMLEGIIKPGLASIINGSFVSSKILKGHNGAIRSVCFSADSKRAISSSNDTKIKIWDVDNQKYITELNYHNDAVPVAVYTKSGEIFSASNDKQVCIWNVSAPESPSSKLSPRVIKREAFNKVNSAALGKSDKDEFVVAALDRTIKRWNIDKEKINDGEIIFTAQDIIVALALSFDGKYLCAGLKNGDVYIKQIKYEDAKHNKDKSEEAKRQTKCCKHNACVSCMAISSDGSFFVTGSFDNSVRLWATNNCKYEVIFESDDNCISAIALSHDNRFVMVGSFVTKSEEESTGFLRLIDLNSRQVRCLSQQNKSLRAIAFSCDGNYALTGSNDNNVVLWSLSKSWLINDLSLAKLILLLKLINLSEIEKINNFYYETCNLFGLNLQIYLENFLALKFCNILMPQDKEAKNEINKIIASYFSDSHIKDRISLLNAQSKDGACRIL